MDFEYGDNGEKLTFGMARNDGVGASSWACAPTEALAEAGSFSMYPSTACSPSGKGEVSSQGDQGSDKV